MQTLESSNDTRIVVFGTGECSKRVLGALRPGVQVVAASDNDSKKWHRQMNGIPVIPPGEIPSLSCDYVVVCSSFASDIIDPLAELGVERKKILSFYEAYGYDPLRKQELSMLKTLIDMPAASSSAAGQERAATNDKSPLDGHRHYEGWWYEWKTHRMEGYFTERHAAVFDVMLGVQAVEGITGDLLEIGVYHGRSAALPILHQRSSETLLLVDARESKSVNALIERHPERRVEYIIGDCRRTASDRRLEERAGRCRWVHVDGDHTFNFVYGDLKSADAVLQDDGLLVMDDAFSAFFPDVTQAMYLYMHEHPGRLELLALGDGKAYLTRPQAHERYYAALAPLFKSEVAKRGWPFNIKRDRDARSGLQRILFRQ